MKTKALSSFFVLFAITAVIGAMTPAAFADHTEVTISPASGSGAPGCEETADGCFIPSTATVDVGGVVIMSNTDTAAHTFTAGTPDGGPSGKFDTGLLMAGNSFEYSPDTAGEIPFFCMVHPWMQGLIIVQEAGAEEHAAGDEHHDEGAPAGDPTATGMLSDGTEVKIWASTPTAGEAMDITIEFEGAQHVNHDMIVTQNGDEVLRDEGAHHH
ncbi:MAG: PEFG-CTERM domain-containing protein, partial [Nitrosopumilus sp.]